MFFFEKKNQKTFIPKAYSRASSAAPPPEKPVIVSRRLAA